jgi:hypothetical protein
MQPKRCGIVEIFKVGLVFTFATVAYNLVRMRNPRIHFRACEHTAASAYVACIARFLIRTKL